MSLDGAHAAADRERNEDLVGSARDDVDDRVAAVGGRGDIKEHELVGAFAVIERGQLDGIAGVAQIDELDALDDAAIGHVQAGNDSAVWPGVGETVAADGWVETQHGASLRAEIASMASARSMRPSYNARPMITPAAPERCYGFDVCK